MKAGGRYPSTWSVTNSLCGTEHLLQSPGLGLGAREEEPRRLSMLEWVWCQMRLDECLRKEDDVIWIWILASLIGSLFVQLGVKHKNTLAFRIRATRGRRPLLDAEAKERSIYEATGHYPANTWSMKKNPPCKRRRQHTRRIRRY